MGYEFEWIDFSKLGEFLAFSDYQDCDTRNELKNVCCFCLLRFCEISDLVHLVHLLTILTCNCKINEFFTHVFHQSNFIEDQWSDCVHPVSGINFHYVGVQQNSSDALFCLFRAKILTSNGKLVNGSLASFLRHVLRDFWWHQSHCVLYRSKHLLKA